MTDRRALRTVLLACCAAITVVAGIAFASRSATARTPASTPPDGLRAGHSRLATSLAPDPVFSGGFETGNLSQWSWGAQCANTGVASNADVARGTIGVEARTVGEGRYAARFNLPPAETRNACEVLQPRPIGIGTDDYYGLMVRFPKKWREPSPAGWGVSLAQLNFENIWGPPVMLVAHAHHISLVLQSGLCNGDTTSAPGCAYSSGPGGNLSPMILVPKPLAVGVWHELLVHVHWATDSSGLIEAWHRLKGQAAWQKTVSFDNHPTLQWSQERLPTLGYSATVDKIGAYRGHAPLPLSLWEDGFVRAGSFAAAAAALP